MAVEERLARRLVTAARKGSEWRERRDALIVQALDAGATQAEVAQLVGLTQPGVRDIAQRVRAAVPPGRGSGNKAADAEE